ncbi:Senecionine N-oxygenase [Eumeta japonica]|uniref:Senecionine N-oxygenase n=1 Tax=Eumeta variegata TaxID=151549 RepID=A0A4C1WTY3_EUMVA|nr:Senecionine N-oxygenase [Eumeta japonica]
MEPKPADGSHTCVIGAGVSGLGAARYLRQHGVNYTVFEASRYIGGTWRFDARIGVDEDGTPLFTSMYKDLRLVLLTRNAWLTPAR